MDKTGVFILGVMVLGIIWSIVKTSLKVWEHKALTRSSKYDWEDRL